jgi:hypothetical protein
MTVLLISRCRFYHHTSYYPKEISPDRMEDKVISKIISSFESHTDDSILSYVLLRFKKLFVVKP